MSVEVIICCLCGKECEIVEIVAESYVGDVMKIEASKCCLSEFYHTTIKDWEYSQQKSFSTVIMK